MTLNGRKVKRVESMEARNRLKRKRGVWRKRECEWKEVKKKKGIIWMRNGEKVK